LRDDNNKFVSDVMTPSMLRMRWITSSSSSKVWVDSSAIKSHLPLVECTAITAGIPASRAITFSPPRPSIPIMIKPRTGAEVISLRVSTVKPAISPRAVNRSIRTRIVARLRPRRSAKSESAARPSRRSSAIKD
jgi:hypothetical protein